MTHIVYTTLRTLDLVVCGFAVLSLRDWFLRRYIGRPKLGWRYCLAGSMLGAILYQALIWVAREIS